MKKAQSEIASGHELRSTHGFQQIVDKRQQVTSPLIEQGTAWPRTPQTPMPKFFPTIATQIPQTPYTRIRPSVSLRAPYSQQFVSHGYPIRRGVKQPAARKEPGLAESLLGCGVLLAMGVLVLALLYYISSPM